jgi:hypothetical protein
MSSENRQSVLYQSPYSGCGKFTGWAKEPCQKAPGIVWPAQRNAPGALLCVDRYHKVPRVIPRVPGPKWGPPRATRTLMTATQAGRFTVRGPSSAGPFSVATIDGIIWAGAENWTITGARPGTESHGLT